MDDNLMKGRPKEYYGFEPEPDYKRKADRYEKALREIKAFCNVTCALPLKMQRIATEALTDNG